MSFPGFIPGPGDEERAQAALGPSSGTLGLPPTLMERLRSLFRQEGSPSAESGESLERLLATLGTARPEDAGLRPSAGIRVGRPQALLSPRNQIRALRGLLFGNQNDGASR